MFADVNTGDWFYGEMAKAVQMKTFKGEGNKLNPNAPITRTEAFVVIARALKLENSSVVPAGFNDLGSIPVWAKGELYALINAGYIAGSNGYINPQNNITRAEFAKVMDNIFKGYIKEAGEYTEVASGNLVVNVPGVTLKDLTISGDLIVADGVGHGDLILDNVNVSGRMVVRGGGVNSIVIKGGSKVGSLLVARVDGAVRIFTEDGSTVETVYVHDGEDHVIIEGTIGKLEVAADVPVVLANATVDSVTLSAPNAQLTVNEGSKVENLLVSQVSEGSKISVAGSVAFANIEAPKATIEGNGEVKEVVVTSTSKDTSIATPNTKITTEKGATNVTGTGGVVIPEGSTANNDKDASKPAVIEKPKAEEKPSSGGPSGSTDKLELVRATMGGTTYYPSNNILEVNFSEGAPGTISATFSESVTLEGISTNGGIDINDATSLFNIIFGQTNVNGNTLTIHVRTDIKEEYLTTYGDEVEVTVKNSAGKPLTITIKFSK